MASNKEDVDEVMEAEDREESVSEGEEGSEEDWDSDDDEEEEDDDDVLEASDSDVSDDDAERCPICLNRFREQDIGIPESCDHCFCLECIQAWAKNVNTCPVDRQVFRIVLCRHAGEDKIYKKLPVEDKDTRAEEEVVEEPTFCDICHECNREDRMLLCDGCDHGYHLDCLTPPLDTVPVDEWFCPPCERTRAPHNEEEDDDEVTGLRPRRLLPRTVAFENVRSALEELRIRRSRQLRRLLDSSEEEDSSPSPSDIDEASSSFVCNTASSVKTTSRVKKARTAVKKTTPKKKAKRKTPRKYRRRKRTAKKRKSTGTKTGTKTKKRRRKRKGKKSARTARSATVSTVKTRIADSLGLSFPKSGGSVQIKKDKSLESKESALSIFGSREELIHFDDDYSAASSASTSAPRTTRYSRLALSSYKPLGRVPTITVGKERKQNIVTQTRPVSAAAPAATGGFDVLGSIMQDQSKLHMDSKNVTIQRDGSLTAKPKETPKPKISKESDTKTATPSLFKSSFSAATDDCPTSSILSSLTASTSQDEMNTSMEEEYDPAHPTDELDENNSVDMQTDSVTKTTEPETEEDEYDPAHPTDEFENSDNENEAKFSENESNDNDNNKGGDLENISSDEDKGHGSSDDQEVKEGEDVNELSSPGFEVDDFSANDEEDFKLGKSDDDNDAGEKSENSNESDESTKEHNKDANIEEDKSNSSEAVVEEPDNDSNGAETGKHSGETVNNTEDIPSENVTENVKTPPKEDSAINKQINIFDEIDKASQSITQSENDISDADANKTKNDVQDNNISNKPSIQKSPKCSEQSNTDGKKSTPKRSPSIKVTEIGKKISPNLKPFEISKKALFDKKRLYDIDFSEDVGFSKGSFPENFEFQIKRIEEVFRDTKKTKENEKPPEKTIETDDCIITYAKIIIKQEPVSPILLSDSEEAAFREMTRKETKDSDKKNSNKSKAKDSDKRNEKKKEKESKHEKLSSKFKPISEKSVDNDKQALTVSDRFKLISDNPMDLEDVSGDEEDPIHEMRKLDKELEYELDKRYSNRKKGSDKTYKTDRERDRDRDQKKSRRRVSLDVEDRHRKDTKENRKDSNYKKQNWEEIEEGEVEDEYRHRKKKEKKRKKSEKDRYYDEETIDKNNDDTRIVIQVSQNTENRTVWETDEKLKKKKEERRKEKEKSEERHSKKDRKRRRHRSRSRSHDRREKSRSRDRSRKSRSRSKDRVRRKRRERSLSRSRDRSLEKSHKKKKKDRSRDGSRDRDIKRSREQSIEEKIDIFGRSLKRDIIKEQPKSSPVVKSKRLIDEDIIIDLTGPSISTTKRKKVEQSKEPVKTTKSKKKSHSKPSKIQTVSNTVSKESSHNRDRTSGFNNTDEKEDEFSDEPEEIEQFQYTDRDEYRSQHKHNQQHTNLIQIGMNASDYDPAVPTDSSSPAPPLPELVNVPTPPLPPPGDFTQFPPPPPGPPPTNMPPPGMILQDRPPITLQVNGPPTGPGILGEGPILLQGPPQIEQGPPPGILPQRLPMNINVLPPGFHQGLPQTLRPQRQLIVPFRPGVQRMSLPPPAPGFGWQVRTAPPPLINGPFDGLPPPQADGPPHSLPPGHPHLGPPPNITEGPPPTIIQLPIEMEDGPPIQLQGPPGHQPPPTNLVHIGPHPHDPQPRLPIPLLPTSEPPPISVMVSIPPPNSSMMSMPPPNINIISSANNAYPRSQTPPMSIMSILGLPNMSTPPPSTSIPGLDMIGQSTMANGNHHGQTMGKHKPEQAISQLEEISKLLNTQAKLMLVSKDQTKKASPNENHIPGLDNNYSKDDNVFKVPHPPAGGKVGGAGSKQEADVTADKAEVVDMDMASPNDEEGNIELPVSPQFDNLIDNTDDWLEEVFNKKNQKNNDLDNDKKLENNKDASHKDKSSTPTKNKDKQRAKKRESPRKPKDDKSKSKHTSKENKPRHRGPKQHKVKKPDADKDFKLKALKDAHMDMDSQEMPSSATEMTNKEKYLRKLHLQERVVEEVKEAIKPHYSNKKINKDQYKEILRKAVPKICHSKSGDINPTKIRSLVDAYIEKFNRDPDGKEDAGSEEISPSVKANGERVKPKTAAR